MSRIPKLLGFLLACWFIAGSGNALADPARAVLNVNYDVDEFGPSDSNLNALDLYLPATPGPRTAKPVPVVVWIHGGGFMLGDKANGITHKARLFNDLGYILASVNYRLSPDISESCCAFAADRVRAPDHIADVAEALAWISRNAGRYGGDPDSIVLAGHSAGAQLVSLAATSPAWVEGRGVSRKQILGAISLDTDTFDVRSEAAPASPLQARLLAWNAFGTPDEESVEARWDRMSPILHADHSDPRFLFVTQSSRPVRMAANQAMAELLGQNPEDAVLGVDLDHEGINRALGSPDDTSAETDRVSKFVQRLVATAPPAGVKITRRPARRVFLGTSRRGARKPNRELRKKVTFGFRGTGRAAGLQCRIDQRRFSKCRGKESYRLRPGRHVFRVRALYPSGRPGNERKATFRIVARRPKKR